jgi:hypothetical protein
MSGQKPHHQEKEGLPRYAKPLSTNGKEKGKMRRSGEAIREEHTMGIGNHIETGEEGSGT